MTSLLWKVPGGTSRLRTLAKEIDGKVSSGPRSRSAPSPSFRSWRARCGGRSSVRLQPSAKLPRWWYSRATPPDRSVAVHRQLGLGGVDPQFLQQCSIVHAEDFSFAIDADPRRGEHHLAVCRFDRFDQRQVVRLVVLVVNSMSTAIALAPPSSMRSITSPSYLRGKGKRACLPAACSSGAVEADATNSMSRGTRRLTADREAGVDRLQFAAVQQSGRVGRDADSACQGGYQHERDVLAPVSPIGTHCKFAGRLEESTQPQPVMPPSSGITVPVM